MPDEVFTPDDFSEEQRMIGDMAQDFIEKEMVPRLPRILKLDFGKRSWTVAAGYAAPTTLGP